MTSRCKVCDKEVDPAALLQLLRIKGKLFAAHFNCGLEWGEEEIEVFKITFGNSYYTLNLMEIAPMEPGDEYTVEKVIMKQGKFYSLPEFEGF